MKHFFFLFTFLLSLSVSYAEIANIFNTSSYRSKVVGFAMYGDKCFQIETENAIWSESLNTYIGLSGEILTSKDGGITWDTLNKYYLTADYKIPRWNATRLSFYFNDTTLCFLQSSGDLIRYNLSTKAADTTNIIDSLMLSKTNVLYFDISNKDRVAISSYNDTNFIVSTNKGDTWEKWKRPTSFTSLGIGIYTYLALLSDNDIYSTRSKTAVSYLGYDRIFFQSGYLIKYAKDTVELSDNFAYSYLYYPNFISDSVGFVAGKRVYYEDENINPDSVFNKPTIFKTTNKGRDWIKVYEPDYFIGTPNNRIKIFGDTIIQFIRTNSSYSVIYSYDLGDTWKVKDLTPLIPEDLIDLIDFNYINSNSFLIAYEDVKNKTFFSIVKEPFLSAPEEQKVFLPDAKIFPNPAVDYVNIEFEPWLGLPSNVELYDILGNKIPAQIYRSEGSVMINTVSLSAGTYTVRISTPNGVIAKAFVKGL